MATIISIHIKRFNDSELGRKQSLFLEWHLPKPHSLLPVITLMDGNNP